MNHDIHDRDLLRRAKEGDNKSRDLLFSRHINLARKICKEEYNHPRLGEFEDKLQESWFAFDKAISWADPEKLRFSFGTVWGNALRNHFRDILNDNPLKGTWAKNRIDFYEVSFDGIDALEHAPNDTLVSSLNGFGVSTYSPEALLFDENKEIAKIVDQLYKTLPALEVQMLNYKAEKLTWKKIKEIMGLTPPAYRALRKNIKTACEALGLSFNSRRRTLEFSY